MKKNLLFFVLIIEITAAQAQTFDGALSIQLEKEAVPCFIDYNSGFHCIFIDKEKIEYHRINHNFMVESKGEILLSNLGLKTEIIELYANRKEIFVAYKRLDSAGLRCLIINTINNKSKKKLLLKNWDKKTEILQSFSVADTLHIISKLENNQISYSSFFGSELIQTKTYPVENEVVYKISQANSKEPQLKKSFVDQSQLGNNNKLCLSKVKTYLSFKYLYITLEDAFSTHVLQINRKLGALTQQKVDFVLENTLLLSGAEFNSFLRGKYLHQAVLTQHNCLVQRYDLAFEKLDYSQTINYHYSTQSQSVVHFLNRGAVGTLESKKDREFVFHHEKRNKYLALHVYKKGPFDHYEISEVEPLENMSDWLQKASDINVENAYRKENGTNTYFGLQWQNTSQFAFLYHIQCMASTFCVSLNQQGEPSPFLGEESFNLAKSSEYYYQFLQRGIVPYQASMAQINGYAYYCFYRKSSKEYYFIKL